MYFKALISPQFSLKQWFPNFFAWEPTKTAQKCRKINVGVGLPYISDNWSCPGFERKNDVPGWAYKLQAARAATRRPIPVAAEAAKGRTGLQNAFWQHTGSESHLGTSACTLPQGCMEKLTGVEWLAEVERRPIARGLSPAGARWGKPIRASLAPVTAHTKQCLVETSIFVLVAGTFVQFCWEELWQPTLGQSHCLTWQKAKCSTIWQSTIVRIFTANSSTD